MTSRKSSKNNVWASAFRNGISQGFLFPTIGAAALLLIFPLSAFFTLRSLKNNMIAEAMTSGEPIGKLGDTMKYILCFQPEFMYVLYTAVVVLMSMMLGVMMFKFIANKRTVNVYYSLGITRTSMFTARYLAGVLMLFAAIAVPLVLCGVINMAFLGSSTYLWQGVLIQTLGLFAIGLVVFSLTAAVFSCVGTIVEGIGFSSIILLSPTLLLSSVQVFMKKLLYGSPYGSFYVSAAGERVRSVSLVSELSRFNPLLFFGENTVSYSAARIEGKDVVLYSSYSSPLWKAPDIVSVLPWIGVAALLFVAGWAIFNRRKAEICGFIGMNRVLNFVITFVVGFFGFSLCAELIGFLPTFAVLLIGAGVFTVIYSVIDFILLRSFKLFGKGLYKLPIHLAAAFAVSLVFITGGFGYSSRTPAASEVKSVEMSTVTNSQILGDGIYRGTNMFSYDGDEAPISTLDANMIGDFTSEADIKKIISLHSDFISLKGSDKFAEGMFGVPVAVEYTMKDGSQLKRYYEYADLETIHAVMELDNTDFFKNTVKANFTEDFHSAEADENGAVSPKKRFAYEDSTVIAVSKMLDSFTPLEMTRDQYEELRSCLAYDLASQTLEQKYYPEKPSIGALWFAGKEVFEPEDLEGNGLSPNNAASDKDFVPDYASNFNFSGGGQGSVVVIQESMKKTVAFLEKNGMLPLFEGKNSITGATVYSAEVDKESYSYVSYSLSLEFLASTDLNNMYFVEYGEVRKPAITDEKLIAELAGASQLQYFTDNKGYICTFFLDDGSKITKYIPAEDAPENIDKYIK